MADKGYRPGDNWIIDDLSGLQIRMSESVKTWDGYRTSKEWWYPRHPQLDIRAIPEQSMKVIDGRPEAPWTFFSSQYDSGPVFIEAPNGSIWKVVITGGVLSTARSYDDFPVSPALVYLGDFYFTVSNAGTITMEASGQTGPEGRYVPGTDSLYVLEVDSVGTITVLTP